jgi:hypothetical protein
MNLSVKERISLSLRVSKEKIFLRKDFESFGDYKQVSRSLKQLLNEGLLDRVGYGIYVKKDSCFLLAEAIASIRIRLGTRVDRIVTLHGTSIRIGKTAAQIAGGKAQKKLDEFKLRIAKEIVTQFSLEVIRRKGLDNLARWKASNVWCSAYTEWQNLFENGTDEELLSAMTSKNENTNRLRQSPPYTGLLSKDAVEKLRKS